MVSPLRATTTGILLCVLVGLSSCRRDGGETAPAAPARLPQVRLLVLVVVDQLGWETLERVRPGLSGGLREFLDAGVVFREAHHLHGVTYTAPGHASLSTGRYPRRHGIVANYWYDRATGEDVNGVGDPRVGRSPRNLATDTLADWLRRADPAARSFALSGKDRGAILLGGHEADAAYWAASGGFVTSDYYPRGRPDWMDEFELRHPTDRWFSTLWEPLADPAALGIQVVEPDEGAFPRTFPHALGDATLIPDDTYYDDLETSPFADVQLALLAQELVLREQLGSDDHLDFLGISFSAVDAVGHTYGPESAEAVDTVLRLDRALGELLDFLEAQVGQERLVLALSADHGVAPLPEARLLEGAEAFREDAAAIVCEQGVREHLARQFGPGVSWLADAVLDREAADAAGLDPAAILDEASRRLRTCAHVADVWTANDLAAEQAPQRLHGRALWRSYFAGRSPDLLITYRPWYVPLHNRGTTHGSPWPYDSHVPILLLLPDRLPRQLDQPVATVDLAPTLATLLGLPRPDDLDGVDLADAVLRQD